MQVTLSTIIILLFLLSFAFQSRDTLRPSCVVRAIKLGFLARLSLLAVETFRRFVPYTRSFLRSTLAFGPKFLSDFYQASARSRPRFQRSPQVAGCTRSGTLLVFVFSGQIEDEPQDHGKEVSRVHCLYIDLFFFPGKTVSRQTTSKDA